VAPAPGLDALADVLEAMERAQDLKIGDPRSGERVVILASILQLLAAYLPSFSLFIMQHGTDPVPEDQDLVFKLQDHDPAEGWLSLRAPGHSVWIPNPEELPEHIRAHDRTHSRGNGETEELLIRRAVAVPLWEPAGNGGSPSSTQETGLLFLLAREELGRDSMLRLAERVSRFVTRRWRHQQEVNLRIHVDGLTGHQAGDAVLRMVARRLQEELRRIDHICRIGGEEFALILPDTSQEAAQEVMGRLLDSLFETSVTSAGETIDIKVTFSFGAVTFPSAGADPFELYRKADAMLFLSKDLGRHRCHFWNTDGDHIQLLPASSAD
jgi:diguanylate cyclase (GGDEF)-like protein